MKLLILASSSKALNYAKKTLDALSALVTAKKVILYTLDQTPLSIATTCSFSCPQEKPPQKITPKWQKICDPLLQSINKISDLDAILVFDKKALRYITASGLPSVPLIWVGGLENFSNFSLYTQTAFRLTKAIFLPPQIFQDEIITSFNWRQSDARTYPLFYTTPIDSEDWYEALTTILQTETPIQPSMIEHALNNNMLPFIGGGSRRLCYELFSTNLCVKFYRQPKDFTKDTHPTVCTEIKKFAHDRKGNTSCQEYDYLQALITRVPPNIRNLFPELVDIVYLPTFGWGLIETLIQNADGTPAQRFPEVLNANLNNPDYYKALVTQLDNVVEELCKYKIQFFDFPNILVQVLKNGEQHLRIADFEPRSRQLIPISTFFPSFLRQKIRRRYHRTFKNCVRPLPPKN